MELITAPPTSSNGNVRTKATINDGPNNGRNERNEWRRHASDGLVDVVAVRRRWPLASRSSADELQRRLTSIYLKAINEWGQLAVRSIQLEQGSKK